MTRYKIRMSNNRFRNMINKLIPMKNIDKDFLDLTIRHERDNDVERMEFIENLENQGIKIRKF